MSLVFNHPIAGEIVDFSSSVRFAGTAPPGVETIALVAVDVVPHVPFASAPVSGGAWAATRKFSGPGKRRIEARGMDANGAPLPDEVLAIAFTLHVSDLAGYQPPLAVLGHLGAVAPLLEVSDRVSNHFIDSRAVFKLPGGQLYIDSNLDLDSDGSPLAGQDATGQSGTSLRMPNGDPINADTVPFFVLPRDFAHKHGLTLGDIAAVLCKDKIAFAIFADHGPVSKIGEGSIALHRALGHETVIHGHLKDADIPRDVITLAFPGSGSGHFQNNAAVAEIGRALFAQLSGAA